MIFLLTNSKEPVSDCTLWLPIQWKETLSFLNITESNQNGPEGNFYITIPCGVPFRWWNVTAWLSVSNGMYFPVKNTPLSAKNKMDPSSITQCNGWQCHWQRGMGALLRQALQAAHRWHHSQICLAPPGVCMAAAHHFICIRANILCSVPVHAVLRARTFCTCVCC